MSRTRNTHETTPSLQLTIATMGEEFRVSVQCVHNMSSHNAPLTNIHAYFRSHHAMLDIIMTVALFSRVFLAVKEDASVCQGVEINNC